MYKFFSLVLITAMFITSCDYFSNMPNDKSLINNYKKNKHEFDVMSKLFESEGELLRLTNEHTSSLGKYTSLTSDKKKKMRTTLNKLSIKEGFLRNLDYKGMFFLVKTEGFTSAGVSKGYYFSENKIDEEKLSDNLDLIKGKKEGVIFKKIDKNWYLYFEVSG